MYVTMKGRVKSTKIFVYDAVTTDEPGLADSAVMAFIVQRLTDE